MQIFEVPFTAFVGYTVAVVKKTGRLPFVKVVEQQRTAIANLVASKPAVHITAAPRHTLLAVAKMVELERIKLGKIAAITGNLVQTSCIKFGQRTACR